MEKQNNLTKKEKEIVEKAARSLGKSYSDVEEAFIALKQILKSE